MVDRSLNSDPDAPPFALSSLSPEEEVVQRSLNYTLIGLVLVPGLASAVPVLNPGNGHYYEAIGRTI